METLAYSHLATIEENYTVESSFEGVNLKNFSNLSLMVILSVATALSVLSITAHTASAHCYDPCRDTNYDSGFGGYGSSSPESNTVAWNDSNQGYGRYGFPGYGSYDCWY